MSDYRHILKQDLRTHDGRGTWKGQRCRIVRFSGKQIQIEFEGGFRAVVDRAAVRRAKESGEKNHGA